MPARELPTSRSQTDMLPPPTPQTRRPRSRQSEGSARSDRSADATPERYGSYPSLGPSIMEPRALVSTPTPGFGPCAPTPFSGAPTTKPRKRRGGKGRGSKATCTVANSNVQPQANVTTRAATATATTIATIPTPAAAIATIPSTVAISYTTEALPQRPRPSERREASPQPPHHLVGGLSRPKSRELLPPPRRLPLPLPLSRRMLDVRPTLPSLAAPGRSPLETRD
ncbi:hypothetical protein ACJJTC_004668 [Scirpophaga incertulas]